MIPLRLVLKNFLSYREATLDFRGIHTACICGANGAGKSSLLEAIAWGIWGESRATTDDDVIHLGAKEALVDFIFMSNQHTYRILRSRYRGQTTHLEFQIAQVNSSQLADPHVGFNAGDCQFRSLTGKGVRATQQRILDHLRLDYETFINSAYLRQGRADEFMLKRPGERKQILADLLKLNQYDMLVEQAKDRARQFKGQIELLEHNLAAAEEQLQQQDAIAQERTTLEAVLAQTQQQQQFDRDRLQALQTIQHQRQTWQQQLSWQQQQQQTLERDCHHLQQELAAAQQQQRELTELLQQESAIAAGYAQFQAVQAQEAQLSTRFKTHQLAQAQRQRYHQQQHEQRVQLQAKLHQTQAQLESLQQQEQELQQTLSKTANIETGLQALQAAREALQHLDQTQLQASPLLQRKQHLQTQIERSQTRLVTRLEELSATAYYLQTQQQRHAELRQALREVGDRIQYLEERRAYQLQVREKGTERRNFMERLQADQRNLEVQLANVEQKIQLLKQSPPGANQPLAGWSPETQSAIVEAVSTPESAPSQLKEHHQSTASLPLPLFPPATPATLVAASAFPPCPLCDRPLDEQHWNLVLAKHHEERQTILDQVWVIREQLAASEREIQILRQEYRALEREQSEYTAVLERRGQLQEQLQVVTEAQQTYQHLKVEIAELERSLQTGDYANELQQELQLLDQSLEALNYDERNHALARGEVDRWRWAEIKHAEIKQAQKRQAKIQQQRAELEALQAELERALQQQQQETQAQLKTLDQYIADVGYDLEQHNQLQAAVRQLQTWQLRYQELLKAQQNFPKVKQAVAELNQRWRDRVHAQHLAQAQTATLLRQLQDTPDAQAEIAGLEQLLNQRRVMLDEQLETLGRLQQQHHHLETLKQQKTELSQQLQTIRRQHRVYHELAQAFGKNGIQALMIENLLPQLEAETNRILARLSASQLHVQFITQRANRRNPSRSKAKLESQKLIETLDILIADTRGTRPYETYSGGEAFRVNFAIRLALARLLAQRSGTALQLLIIDEGFGTQDAEGCDRLIAAINAIASDFACILAITHVPHFKEAFQARIEVYKTEAGSQLHMVG